MNLDMLSYVQFLLFFLTVKSAFLCMFPKTNDNETQYIKHIMDFERTINYSCFVTTYIIKQWK